MALTISSYSIDTHHIEFNDQWNSSHDFHNKINKKLKEENRSIESERRRKRKIKSFQWNLIVVVSLTIIVDLWFNISSRIKNARRKFFVILFDHSLECTVTTRETSLFCFHQSFFTSKNLDSFDKDQTESRENFDWWSSVFIAVVLFSNRIEILRSDVRF